MAVDYIPSLPLCFLVNGAFTNDKAVRIILKEIKCKYKVACRINPVS